MKIDNEFKNLIPELAADEYRELERSILAEGCRDALVVWEDTLIDGHNRYEICTKHGLPFDTVERVFSCRENVIEWIIRNQFARRNLPAYERARLALRLKPVIAERAKENLAIGAEITNTGLQKSVKAVNTQKEIAKAAGVSHDTIAKVERIEQSAPEEIKQKLRNQEISINQAYQTIRREEKLQAVEKRIEEHKTVQTGVVDIYNTDKKYNIIYADPAWTYGDWANGMRNPSNHYKLMTTGDICGLPVERIADENCILFMWVTYPLLPEGLDVLKAWGFKYKTAGFVWVKKNKSGDGNFFGLGNWTRANSEICIIGVKGNVTRIDAGISQVIESPIEEHSKKPAIARELITRLVGKLPRIELFSRDTVDGWDCWGNEV